MVRRKDRFWEYAEELNDRFRCNFCNRDFAGGISRIKSHLSGITGRGIDVCTAAPEEVQHSAVLAIGNPFKKAKISIDTEQSKSIPASSHCLLKSLCPNVMPKTCEGDQSAVDYKLAKYFVSNRISFDVVGAQSFVDFVKGVAEYGPNYNLPGSATLQRKYVPQLQMEVERYTANMKKSWAATGCTIMLDECGDSICVIAYSARGAVFKGSYAISKHENCDILDSVSSAIEDVGVDHVVQLITKRGTKSDVVGDMLLSKYPRIYKTYCVAHEIHSLLKDICDSVVWVKQIMDDAELIVKHMYEDSVVLSLLRKYTNKELKQPCKGKFASCYQMLQSILDNQNELQQLVASEEWGLQDYNITERAMMMSDAIQSTDFWSRGQDVLEALNPLIQVLRLVEDDGCTSGYLYEAMEKARVATLQLSNNIKYAKFLELFAESRKKIIASIHAAAAFLNPNYMCRENFFEGHEMKEGIEFMLKNLVAAEEKKLFPKEVLLYRKKVSNLFTEMASVMMETSHPCAWWDYCGEYLPVLKKYAMRILSQPCKCSIVHKYTQVARPMTMNRVEREMQDDFCIAMNSLAMEKLRDLEERCLQPIDIENCCELPDYADVVGQDQDEDQAGTTADIIETCCELPDHVEIEQDQDDEYLVDIENCCELPDYADVVGQDQDEDQAGTTADIIETCCELPDHVEIEQDQDDEYLAEYNNLQYLTDPILSP